MSLPEVTITTAPSGNRRITPRPSPSPQDCMKEFRIRHEVEGPYVFKDPIPTLYSYVDPYGGGVDSDFALVTMACERDQYILVAMSHWRNKHTANAYLDINRMLQQHYQRIFDHPLYTDAKVYLYWNTQIGHVQADQCIAYIQGLFPGKILRCCGYGPVDESCEIPEVVTRQHLWYASDFIISDIGDRTTEESAKMVKGEFEAQMCDIITNPVDKSLVFCVASIYRRITRRVPLQTQVNNLGTPDYPGGPPIQIEYVYAGLCTQLPPQRVMSIPSSSGEGSPDPPSHSRA
jgi:hypothetical protein